MPAGKKDARPASRGRARLPAFVKNQRGVKNWKEVGAWLEWRGIEDIECITPDQAGVARGKMMPSKKFTSNTSLALPSAVFMTTISGGYPEDGNGFHYPEDDGDLKLMPDLSTLTVVPWEEDPTAAGAAGRFLWGGKTPAPGPPAAPAGRTFGTGDRRGRRLFDRRRQ